MARLVVNTLSAFESFDDRRALFDGGVELTYRELLAEINRLARALTRRGLQRGDGLLPWPK